MSKPKGIATLGASNHSLTERAEYDFYRTDPVAATALVEVLGSELPDLLWECSCGDGALSKELEAHGKSVLSTDLIDRGYGTSGVDFLAVNTLPPVQGIVTNPPFNLAHKFIEHALDLVPDSGMVCFFIRTLMLEGIKRYKLFQEHPPKYIIVSSRRINCNTSRDIGNRSAMSFSWFVWEKGFKGEPTVKWFDYKDYKQLTT